MGKTFSPRNEQRIHRQTDTGRRRGGGWEKFVLVVSASITVDFAKRGTKSENVTLSIYI